LVANLQKYFHFVKQKRINMISNIDILTFE